ncbi:YcxB family protein [Streptomyces sp. NPDC002133]|uniref:YcxB family protein n=1 Tax=Streptomyces sp. NPDC002133 TaxID=3154409 RepID=UPI003328853F
MPQPHQGTDQGADRSNDPVQLVYLPKPADTLVGLRVRERIKRMHLVRGAFLALFAAVWLLPVVARGRADVVQTALWLFIVLVIWGYPRIQAAHVQRIVGWQGEYHVTVSEAGISCTNDHSTLTQNWSLFQGHRETAGHFVLLSRDPNIMVLDVLPKRGLSAPGEADRLRALLDRNVARA